MGRGFDGLPQHVEIGDVWVDVSIRESHEATADVTLHPVEEGTDIADHIRPEPRTIQIDGLVTNTPIEVPLSHVGTTTRDRTPLELRVASPNPPRVFPHAQTILGEPSAGALSVVPGVDQAVALLGAMRVEVRSKVSLSMEQYFTNPLATTTLSAQALRFTQPFDRVGAVHEALQRIIDESVLVTVVTGLAIYQQVALRSLSTERSADVGPDVLKFTAHGIVLRIVSSEIAKLPDPVKARGKPAVSQGKQDAQPVDIAAERESLTNKFLAWATNWLETRQ